MKPRISDDCVYGVVGVLEQGDRMLMIQRSECVLAPGKWCFPGGTIEEGETAADTIVREMREEVGLEVEADRKLWSWTRDDGRLNLEWWSVRLLGGDLTLNPAEVQAAQWMTEWEIRNHSGVLPNNIPFLDHYRSASN